MLFIYMFSDETVRLWDIQSGECVRLLTGHTATVRSLAMSPDGRYAASGTFMTSHHMT